MMSRTCGGSFNRADSFYTNISMRFSRRPRVCTNLEPESDILELGIAVPPKRNIQFGQVQRIRVQEARLGQGEAEEAALHRGRNEIIHGLVLLLQDRIWGRGEGGAREINGNVRAVAESWSSRFRCGVGRSNK